MDCRDRADSIDSVSTLFTVLILSFIYTLVVSTVAASIITAIPCVEELAALDQELG
jgi:hypothetical protein